MSLKLSTRGGDGGVDVLLREFSDVDGDGRLSVGDEVSILADGGVARVRVKVEESDLANAAALGKFLTKASNRDVAVFSESRDVYVLYSSPDRKELEGVIDGASGVLFDRFDLDLRYQAPDYAQGYPATARRAALKSCAEASNAGVCTEKVEAGYQELLRLAQAYDVERTKMQDAGLSLSALFLSGALTSAAIRGFMAGARATSAAWSEYATYDL